MDKICRICHQQKPLSEFYNDANNRDGLTTLCKDCTKEASRQYRASPRGRAMRKLRRYKDKQKIQAFLVFNNVEVLCPKCFNIHAIRHLLIITISENQRRFLLESDNKYLRTIVLQSQSNTPYLKALL